MDVQANIIIHGKVQGVWYRQSTKNVAERLGLTGWVRNLPDRTVEACIVGERERVEKLISWCQQGPPAANVTNIDVEWQDAPEQIDSFQVR